MSEAQNFEKCPMCNGTGKIEATVEIVIKKRCPKCGHSWIPRVASPLKCPRCGHFPDSQIYV